MIDFSSFSPSNFSRYISQSEELPEETLDIEEWTPSGFSAVNEIPSLMSLQTNVFTKSSPRESAMQSNFFPMNVSDKVDSVPRPHHGPGPIQRPNKLAGSTAQSSGSLNMNSMMHSPNSPDVLDQINQLVYEPNSSTSNVSMTSSNHNSSNQPMINDLNSPSIPWTPFATSDWQNKNESSWLLTNLQSSPIPIGSTPQNPFAMITSMNDHQRQIPQNETPFWSTILNTTTQHFPASGTRSQHHRQWDEMFSSSSSSTNDSAKSNSNSWSKMWPVSDASSTNTNLIHGRQTVSTNAPWDLNDLSTDSVVPNSNRRAGANSPSGWWPAPLSDENNNKNSSNYDSALNRDQSRWDFAR